MPIIVGPAGLGSPAVKGLDKIKKAGLKCAEVEFTHSIYMNNKMANEIGQHAEKLGIKLSIHCPYYINLCSSKKSVRKSSKKRILDSAERGHYLNAKYIVFHSGYYGNLKKEQAYKIVKDAVLEMNKVIKKNKWKVMLCPETTGKVSQFGDLDELYKLHRQTRCAVCVDFAHMRAKYKGKIDYKHICGIMKKFKFSPLHAHFSGITWGPKGEKSHKITPINEIKELLKWLKKYKFNISLINESPNPFGDAVKTSRLLH
ncbi:TIM barrel protein [Candidatus Woesearchaeota archaeon]|nr:TIM barrel protein [Candidatus Woesearchaeota archaeon]